MAAFNEEMVKAGILLDGAGLKPSSKGVRIRTEGGLPGRRRRKALPKLRFPLRRKKACLNRFCPAISDFQPFRSQRLAFRLKRF